MTIAHPAFADKTDTPDADEAAPTEPTPTPQQAAFLAALDDAMDQTGEADDMPLMRLSGGPGVGKAQPLDSLILMADGAWKLMRDIAVGDSLASSDGAPSEVTAVHPRGTREIYRVETVDGRVIRCCADHLWTLTLGRSSGRRTVSTVEMMRLASSVKYEGRVGLPLITGDFGVAWPEAVDPYILGALLGDGGITGTGITFTTGNPAVVDEIKRLMPEGYALRKNSSPYGYGLARMDASRSKPNLFSMYMRRVGLMGHKSVSKFIPEQVFGSDRATRVAVIQGLMDTDGTVGRNGAISFDVASERLARDFQRLVQSVGAVSRIRFKANDKAGCWRQTIRHRNPQELFRKHQRQPVRAVKGQYTDRLTLKIKSVTRVDSAPCQCISVSHPSRLYVTDGYTLTHNSFTISRAALKAAAAGWCVFLIGPTHQATGVLASAVPTAFPFEPDPKAMLNAGEIMYCTAHKMGMWVQKSRARQAAVGVSDPVPRDSWLGRSFRASWDSPPEGCMLICDETSMYPGQMTEALHATIATLRREIRRVVFVAVGDPNQLTPVRGPAYDYLPGEGPESPSRLVTDSGYDEHVLSVNVRAKDPVLRNVVETYLHHKIVPTPPADPGAPYGWTDANDIFYHNWAALIDTIGTSKCIMLGYRRATVASANERMCQIIHGTSAAELQLGRIMRVQETYSPRQRTLAASSDLVEVKDVQHVTMEALGMIVPPEKGHAAAHDPRVLQIVTELLEADITANGPLPTATVQVRGDRAGLLRDLPVQIMTEAEGMTQSETRWAKLEGALTMAAFRRPHADATVRRGLAAIYYFMADSAKLKLEAPYAMTSHRAQGSTYAHVAVLADSPRGGRVVDFRVASARDASAYVMLSRASESLTIAWQPRLQPMVANAAFNF